MKEIAIYNSMITALRIGSIQAVIAFFIITNLLPIKWGALNAIIIFSIGLPASYFAGSALGVLLYGMYLCRRGQAGEIDRWVRHSELNFLLHQKVKAYLKSYAASHK